MKLPIRRRQVDDEGLTLWPPGYLMDVWNNESWLDPFELMPNTRRLRGGWLPKVDVSETNQEIRVKVDTPDVDPKLINISVEDNMLTISGRTEEKREEKGETWHRTERSVGTFQRTIELPRSADAEKISANAKNGTLSIIIPKKAEEQKKRIAVKVQE